MFILLKRLLPAIFIMILSTGVGAGKSVVLTSNCTTPKEGDVTLIESRIIFCQSRQREDCFQKAVIKRGLRRIRRKALRARWSSSQ